MIGNPGLSMFYEPFLNAIHVEHPSSSLAILAPGYMGHAREEYSNDDSISLASQEQHALEAFDHVKEEYSSAKVVLMGHSVGSWILLQVRQPFSSPEDHT